MQTTASAINREELDGLLQCAKEGGVVSPNKFASMVGYHMRDVEAWAKVMTHTADIEPEAPELQAYMASGL